MTTYVMLANWTDQGALKVKDSPRRLDAAKEALKDMSGRTRTLKAFPEAAYREIISSLG